MFLDRCNDDDDDDEGDHDAHHHYHHHLDYDDVNDDAVTSVSVVRQAIRPFRSFLDTKQPILTSELRFSKTRQAMRRVEQILRQRLLSLP